MNRYIDRYSRKQVRLLRYDCKSRQTFSINFINRDASKRRERVREKVVQKIHRKGHRNEKD